ncbi:hypothetical protein NW762_014669 [Fusarium torreyae]|uniref:Uncharacterized protein n=1 Tax=Fusarium torreyae TaxID=1237075 RepID=A0A9W8V6F5_9HYPO|nr:hypothetical protein NW762_014669 [Fusarium torreyae]
MVHMDGVITSFCLIGGALAQSSNSSFEDCPVSIKDIADKRLYNSTGTVEATFKGQDDPWEISVALTDTRAPNLWFGEYRSDQAISIYLSVSESLVGSRKGNETFVCAYMMTGFNETSTNSIQADDPCDGILSDECVEDLTKISYPNSSRCPQSPKSEKCDRNFTLSQITPLNFSSSSCALGNLPEIDLPSDYRTYGGLPGGSFPPASNELETFDVYDLKVRQPIPLLFSCP